MEYINLGPTDQLVPKIGFGTARFHFEDGILRRAVELGMSLIDTAESYSTWGDAPGVGERHVGEQIAGFRDKVSWRRRSPRATFVTRTCLSMRR